MLLSVWGPFGAVMYLNWGAPGDRMIAETMKLTAYILPFVAALIAGHGIFATQAKAVSPQTQVVDPVADRGREAILDYPQFCYCVSALFMSAGIIAQVGTQHEDIHSGVSVVYMRAIFSCFLLMGFASFAHSLVFKDKAWPWVCNIGALAFVGGFGLACSFGPF